ncbi:hypothetical protein GVAV_001809 [Gurleya vavrai]
MFRKNTIRKKELFDVENLMQSEKYVFLDSENYFKSEEDESLDSENLEKKFSKGDAYKTAGLKEHDFQEKTSKKQELIESIERKKIRKLEEKKLKDQEFELIQQCLNLKRLVIISTQKTNPYYGSIIYKRTNKRKATDLFNNNELFNFKKSKQSKFNFEDIDEVKKLKALSNFKFKHKFCQIDKQSKTLNRKNTKIKNVAKIIISKKYDSFLKSTKNLERIHEKDEICTHCIVKNRKIEIEDKKDGIYEQDAKFFIANLHNYISKKYKFFLNTIKKNILTLLDNNIRNTSQKENFSIVKSRKKNQNNINNDTKHILSNKFAEINNQKFKNANKSRFEYASKIRNSKHFKKRNLHRKNLKKPYKYIYNDNFLNIKLNITHYFFENFIKFLKNLGNSET